MNPKAKVAANAKRVEPSLKGYIQMDQAAINRQALSASLNGAKKETIK